MAGLYEEKILGAEQSRELARKLRESGEAIPQGQMVSGWYVPPSIAQSLAGALKQGIGAYKENQAEDELKGLKQERARSSADAFSQMGMQAPSGLLAEAGTPAVKPSIMDRIGAALTFNAQPKGTPAQPYQQTIAQNPNETQTMGGILNLAGSNPEMAAVAQAMQGQKWTRENAAALAKQALIEKNAAREDTQAFQAQQNELARLQAKALHDDTLANRPQPQAPQGSVVEIVDPNDPTKMIKINSITGEPYGYSGAEPKAALRQEKADAAAEKQAKAQEGFATELDTIESNYNYLNEHGGITNPKKSAIANIGSYLSQATGPTLGVMGGTANQSARNTIEGARSRMIPMFKEATGMSSKQMDSNTELKAAKNTLTNPDVDYASNMQAIAALKKEYTKRQSSGDIHSQADAILGK